jgi:hypothetical protein
VDAVDVQTAFSTDLQPLPNSDSKTGAPARFGQAYWIVAAKKDKPVTIEAENKDGSIQAHLYRLSKSRPFASKDVPVVGKATVQLNVPEDGLYGLIVRTTNATTYRIVEPIGSVIDVGRDADRNHILKLPPSLDALYFHVPKGTKAFVMHFGTLAGRQIDITLFDGAKRRVTRFTQATGERTIHVPEGSDGQVWHLALGGNGAAGPTMYLLGIPPYVQVNPNHLLTPRECL